MKKNKLFTLFSLTLLSMGTPLTSIAQVVAVSQDMPAITSVVNEETEKKQEPVTTDEDKTGKDQAEPVTTDQKKTDQEKSDKKETEAKETEKSKDEKITPSDKKTRSENPGNLKNDGPTWGNASWSFDANTGSLTIKSGTLGQVGSAPWKRDDDKKIDANKIKKISFTGVTKAPKNANYLFQKLNNLTEFENLPYLDTSETTSMVDMFLDCKSLTTLDLSKFNTKNATDMRGTFRGCTSIKSLDLSNLDTLNVTEMNKFFENVPLVSLTLGDNFKFIPVDITLSKPKSLLSTSELQREGKKLTGKWIKKDNQSAAYNTQKFMENYGKGDLTAGTYVAETKSMLWGDAPCAFDADTGTVTIGSGDLDNPNKTESDRFPYEQAPWDLPDNTTIDKKKVKKIIFTGPTKAPSNYIGVFYNLISLTEIVGLENFDTSNVTSMYYMFGNCTSLKKLDLSTFNTSKVTRLEGMFAGSSSLESLNLSSFDTSKVTSMVNMFGDCPSLNNLDLSNFNTANMIDMKDMFKNTGLSSLTLGNDFTFVNDRANLPKPAALTSEVALTGKWIKKDNQSAAYTPNDFMANYGKGDLKAGTYVAETKSLLWGSSSWTFDKNTGVLTINSGTLGQVGNAPWKLTDERKIDADKIKKIRFTGATKAPKESTYLFRKLTSLTEIEGLTYLDTSEVTNMTGMFYDCYNLKKLDLSNFNTSNVTSMERMFFFGTNLESLDLSKFDTKNVTDMTGLFFNCGKLKTLDLSGFNTIKNPTMTVMFNGTVLSSLTLGNDFRFIGDDSNLPAPSVLNAGDSLTGKWIKENRGSYPQSPGGFMRQYGKNELTAGTYVAEIKSDRLWGDAPWTFDENTGTLTIESGRLVKSDQSPWKRDDEKKIDDTKIKKIIFTGPVLAPEDSTYLFRKLTSLTEIEGLTYLDTSEVTNMTGMFYDCYSLKKLDLSNFNTSNVTSMERMFFFCFNLESLDLSKFNTKNVTDMTGLFFNCGKLKTLDLSGFNTIKNPTMTVMFNGTVLSSLTLGNDFRFIGDDSNLPTPAALNAGDPLTGKWIKKNRGSYSQSPGSFMKKYGTKDLTAGTYIAEIKSDRLWGDAPWSFDENTGTLTIESGRLVNSKESPWKRNDEKKIDGTKIKKIIFTGPVLAPEDSTELFRKLTSLTEIENLTYLDTSEVTNMNKMFYDCYNLKKLDLSNFNTTNVTSIAYMFFYCVSLESLDLSKFDTKKVTDMSGLFQACKKLKTLDLSGFNTLSMPKMTGMFNDTVLSSLTLGNDFRFSKKDANLPVPLPFTPGDFKRDGKYLTGNWIKKDKQSAAYDTQRFMTFYGKYDLTAGTYVAEIKSLLWGDAPLAFDSDTGLLTINSGTLGEFDTAPWELLTDSGKIDANKIKKIRFTGATKAPENSEELFSGLNKLTEFENLTYLDTSEVTNMDNMFNYCYELRQLDLSNFNTSNVTSIEKMFFYCVSIESLDLSKFDTKNVTDMTGLFLNCWSLKTLDLSGFNTIKKPTMTDMFNGTILSSLTLGNDFRFETDANLPVPVALTPGVELTGKWIKENRGSYAYSPDDFMKQYGTKDLTAGTYVTEAYISMSVLETSLSFSTDSGKTGVTTAAIGDQLQGKLTVKHAAGSAEGSTSIAVKLSAISLLTDAWTLSPTVTVTTFDQTGKQTASKEQTIKDDALSLPVLPYGSYFEITLNGTAWEKAYAIPSGNCNYTLTYKNQAGDQKIDKSDNFVINSGALRFKSVPNISFKDSVLPLASNLIIDRKDDDYALTVTDYRSAQLPSDGQTTKPDRVNWEITATASPFKDAAGKEIKLSTMAVSFTKAIGQTTELGADATLITSHDVTGETAKQNNLTKLSWDKALGFKVVVHNRTDLNTTKYTADVAFDLRTAP